MTNSISELIYEKLLTNVTDGDILLTLKVNEPLPYLH